MRTAIMIGVALAALVLGGCGPSSAPVSTTQATEATSVEAQPADQGNWIKSETTDKMDSTKQIVLMTNAADQSRASLIVRFKGKTLDVYVNTGEIVDDESASVRVKFDEGAPMKQTWTRSKDYAAVFSPYPFDLLKRLQTSNKFYLEYHPYQRVPDTIAFNVTGLTAVLPQTEMDAQRKKSDNDAAASAALKARVQRNTHQCEEKNYLDELRFPGQWCWTDPNSALYDHEGTPFPTKEQALSDAMDKARMGLAFKN